LVFEKGLVNYKYYCGTQGIGNLQAQLAVLPDGLSASQILANPAYLKCVWPKDSGGL